MTAPLAISQFLHDFWPHITGAAVLVIELAAVGHAVLYKRDSRATIGWVGLILLTPLLGALLYWVFGINRIHRRATLMRRPAGIGAGRFGACHLARADQADAGQPRGVTFCDWCISSKT